jgi:RND superfamily putative drug exporter
MSFTLLLLLTMAAAVWGLGVFGAFKQDNFATPGSQSSRVAQLSVSYFGSTNPDVLVLYTDPNRTVDDPTYMRDVITTVARLPTSQVAQISDYWSSGRVKELVSRDRHSTIVSIKLAGNRNQQLKNYLGPANDPKHPALAAQLQAPGLHTRLAGNVPMGEEFLTQMMQDIVRAESISFVPLLVLLLIIFGSFTAAWLPLIVGGFSVIGGLAVLRVFTMLTAISTYSGEVVTMLGLGLAVDYSLFIVTRFREELAKGRDRETALSNTMATAGRTVAFSGITVATALAGLLFFPQMFLRSIGFGGISVVLVAVLGANLVLPTMLAILGRKVEFGQMPWRKRKARKLAQARAEGIEPNPDTGFWYRLGRLVMKHPLPFLVSTMTVLILFFTPFLHAQFGTVDVRVLPKASPTRQVTQFVKDNFPGGSTETIDVVISGSFVPPNWRPDPSRADDKPPVLEDFRQRLLKLPYVTAAEYTGYDASFGGVRISVTQSLDPMSVGAKRLVATIRAMQIQTPPGQTVYVDVGGSTAGQMDEMASISRTPS